jgi:hypothetical protein
MLLQLIGGGVHDEIVQNDYQPSLLKLSFNLIND